MVVKREKANVSEQSVVPEPSAAQVEAFVSRADGELASETNNKPFKRISIAFTQQEYSQLELAARCTGRSKLSVIRRAIHEMAKRYDK